MNRKLFMMACLICTFFQATAQEGATTPKISGTIRGKYEYQTEEGEGRFEVRNARISVTGDITPLVSYKAEIDLCDEGNIKMLDAYTRIKPATGWQFTIGQMRVPFTIDAHRSPHLQYFANRSFIAKQVGNVRDVGAEIGCNINIGVPLTLQAGIFNGSGLTNQKDFWTKNVNFSAKGQLMLPWGTNIVLSAQKVKPGDVDIMMYDAGINFHRKRFVAEAEYLYKHYSDDTFDAVHAFDGFVCYDIPFRRGPFSKMSVLARYDFMSDHSDGMRYLDGKLDENGVLKVTDYKRSRVTGGITLSFAKPFVSDIRINYEKYFYAKGSIPKVSERDKIVIEVMTHF